MEYRLAYYGNDGGRRIETSADFPALRARADELLKDLNEGRAPDQTDPLTIGERNDYARALEILALTKQSLITAATHFAKAVEILGGDLVVLAAQEYVKRHLNKIEPRPLATAVTDFIEEKERQNRSECHVDRLRIHLTRLANAIVANVGTVTGADIDRFLGGLKVDGKPVGARTRDNHADSIVTFYRWAKRKRYVPADYNEMERITRLHNDEDGPVEIYSPDQMTPLLRKASPELKSRPGRLQPGSLGDACAV